MNTFILNAETSGLSIEHLLKQAEGGGVQVQDANGKVVAFVLPPADHEALTNLEAIFERYSSSDQLRDALKRSGGITTAELLSRAELAAQQAGR